MASQIVFQQTPALFAMILGEVSVVDMAEVGGMIGMSRLTFDPLQVKVCLRFRCNRWLGSLARGNEEE